MMTYGKKTRIWSLTIEPHSSFYKAFVFNDSFISETPLSLIAGIRARPSRMVMALVNGGAILDFRTKDGSTAMHRYKKLHI